MINKLTWSWVLPKNSMIERRCVCEIATFDTTEFQDLCSALRSARSACWLQITIQHLHNKMAPHPFVLKNCENIILASTISDYDLGGEGDLFKAPEPIIEEPIVDLDPMTAAIAMISRGDNVMPPPCLKVGDIESLQNEPLLSDVFDGCRKELLEKTSVETTVSDVLDIKFPLVMTTEAQTKESKSLSDVPFTKSGSSGSLSSMEWVSSATERPNFLDFSELDLGAAYGMRRAFSDGDIKTLGNGNINLIHSPIQRPLVSGTCTAEDRLQKLSRYRNKKSRRNFGRKIKYACRKALADSQPRIRGRFAKTEDADSCKSLQQTSTGGV